jgi:hypothetical protein
MDNRFFYSSKRTEGRLESQDGKIFRITKVWYVHFWLDFLLIHEQLFYAVLFLIVLYCPKQKE